MTILLFLQECDNVILVFSVKESGKFQGKALKILHSGFTFRNYFYDLHHT